MKPIEDVELLSEFLANAAGMLRQLRETRRPIVLTEHGKSAAVVRRLRGLVGNSLVLPLLTPSVPRRNLNQIGAARFILGGAVLAGQESEGSRAAA